ncbi:flagellar basal body-associated FliL family protein [Desertibaculum subflavum]|uniref:flagellar basal body-associated FliL family protein n=1 Tax=Desertibaculum subflavum TaxID=2268458 RepID=UPI000E661AF3
MAAKDKDQDAEIEGADGQAQPVPKAGFGLRKIVILVVLPLLLMLIGGAGAWFFVFNKSDDHAAEEAPPKHTVFLDLPDMLVNLNTGGTGRASYLKLKVALEFEEIEAPKKVEALMPRVIDNFQVYLRELRADDLAGSAGLYRIKEELLLRVSHAVQPIKVNDVLFKEMLVQQ